MAANFLRRGYLELLRPLDNWQICPVLFLWAERAVVDALGFREWTLRLVPLLCGLAALGLFPKMARCVAKGSELLLAVGIFAVSAAPIRHASEVKAYAGDLLVALCFRPPGAGLAPRPWTIGLALGAGAGRTDRSGGVASGGVCGGGGEPGAGGGGLEGSPGAVVAPFLAFNAVVATTFVLLYVFILKNQDAAMPVAWRSYWDVGFPPLSRPLAFLRRLAGGDAHGGHVWLSGRRGTWGKHGDVPATVTGAMVLWRRRERAFLATLLGPFA